MGSPTTSASLVVPIDLSGRFDAASVVLAWLAYPENGVRRKKFCEDLMCRARIAELMRERHGEALKGRVFDNIYRGLKKIVNERRVAGMMALALLNDDQQSMTKLSKIVAEVNGKMTDEIREPRERFIRTTPKVKNVIWTGSKPVMHLSCALIPLLNATRDEQKPIEIDAGDIYKLIVQANWLPAFIRLSAKYRLLIADSVKIEIDADQMIDIGAGFTKNEIQKFC